MDEGIVAATFFPSLLFPLLFPPPPLSLFSLSLSLSQSISISLTFHKVIDGYDSLFGVKSAADRFAFAVNRQLWHTQEPDYPSFYLIK